MRLAPTMSEETLGKIMLAALALATVSAVALFLLTKSAAASALRLDHSGHPVLVSR